MPNSYFQFKQFTIHQDRCAMKVTTDACLFGAWIADKVKSQIPIAIGTKVKNILDIGTGTGLIALMIAQENPQAFIDAIEIDKDAAQQAKENAEASPWRESITIINADVRDFEFSGKYDLIVSNPPFYEREIRSTTGVRNIAHHSDELTLHQLLSLIKNNLAHEGCFFILLPYKRNEEVKKLLKEHELHIEHILFVRQSVSHDYFRIILKGKLSNGKNEETGFDELSIWDEKQHYTRDFVELLKGYYLNL